MSDKATPRLPRVQGPGDKPKIKLVKLNGQYGNCFPGEIVGLPEHEANRLLGGKFEDPKHPRFNEPHAHKLTEDEHKSIGELRAWQDENTLAAEASQVQKNAGILAAALSQPKK